MMRGRFAWADVRAGYIDARRTPSPKWCDGRRFGGLDYTLGYAAGVASVRWFVAARPCAECGARRGEPCSPFCTGLQS